MPLLFSVLFEYCIYLDIIISIITLNAFFILSFVYDKLVLLAPVRKALIFTLLNYRQYFYNYAWNLKNIYSL